MGSSLERRGSPDASAPVPLPKFLPQHIIDRTLAPEDIELILSGIPVNTRITYRREWGYFVRWCSEAKRTSLPATEETLVTYIRHLRDQRRCAPSTAEVSMAAIRRFHRYGSPPTPWEAGQRVTDALKGLRRRRLEEGWRPKRSLSASKEQVRLLADTCDPETTDGTRDRVVILLGYRFAARASELGTLRIADLAFTEDGVEVHLAMSKNDQAGHGATTAIPYGNNPQYCAVTALRRWLTVLAEAGITEGPMMRPLHRGGHLIKTLPPRYRFTTDAVDKVFAKALARARATLKQKGLPDGVLAGKYTPHSLRRGWAKDARRAGADALDIIRGGRWSPRSKVPYDYMEDADRWTNNPNKAIDL